MSAVNNLQIQLFCIKPTFFADIIILRRVSNITNLEWTYGIIHPNGTI